MEKSLHAGCSNYRPPVIKNGTVLFVGTVFSSAPYGSHVVMRELLRNFDPDSFRILADDFTFGDGGYEFERQTFRLRIRKGLVAKIPYGGCLMGLLSVFRVRRLLARRPIAAIVAVYPSLDLLPLGILLAKILKVPFFLYLHDTLYEALSKSKMRFLVRKLQDWSFSEACRLFVMSEGMRELYQKKYGLISTVIAHCYSEPIPGEVAKPASRTLFWAGGVYGINDRSFMRVVRAATRMNITVKMTACGEVIRKRINKWREEGLLVEPVFYESRADYLAALRQAGALLLALNHPDESSFGKDELATIFSTKVPEYLASGRPVIINCPKEYFLARFFAKHRCGVVVDQSLGDRGIETAIDKALSNDAAVRQMCQSALIQAKRFTAGSVADKFSCALEKSIAGV